MIKLTVLWPDSAIPWKALQLDLCESATEKPLESDQLNLAKTSGASP